MAGTRITQAHWALSGRRYGSFAGKTETESPPEAPASGGGGAVAYRYTPTRHEKPDSDKLARDWLDREKKRERQKKLRRQLIYVLLMATT